MGMNDMMAEIMGIVFHEQEGVCPKHGPVKLSVASYPDGRITTECPECVKEDELAEEKELSENQKAAEISKYIDSNIETEYWDKTLEDYKPSTESQKKMFESVKELIESKSGKIVVLGANGVGKTMLASMVVKALGGKIYSMYEISTMIRQSYTNRAEKTELEIVKELAAIPFLAIDELGRTKGSDAELNWLSYVLDKRHTRNLPFMLMSNTHLAAKCPNHGCSQCFENYINNDILSRLRQNSKIITVDGPDYRAKK